MGIEGCWEGNAQHWHLSRVGLQRVGLVGPLPHTHPSLEMGKVGTGHRRHGSEKVELPQALLRSPAQPGLTFFVHPGPMTSASKPAAD